SGAKAEPYKLTTENTANSILSHALYGIDYPKVIERAYEDGARIFIEMGPGGSCSRMISQILKGKEHMALSFSTNKGDELSNVIRALARLASEGVKLNLDKLYSDSSDTEIKIDSNSTIIPVGKKTFADIPLPQTKKSLNTPPKIVEISKPANDVVVETGNVAIDSTQLIEAIGRTAEAGLEAHQTFLNFSEKMRQAMEENIAQQIALVNSISQEPTSLTTVHNTPSPLPKRDIAFDRGKCMEIAIGKIGNVLGEKYSVIDTYPTRVRLPDEPLMLVDRIMSIEGEALSLTNGRVVTEHDVKHNGWYLDCGRIPTCIAVEAGQADLFLSGYLGIDLETKGMAVYRLLDAVVTFHSPLPVPGDVIKYDIKIERFFRQGDTYLFNFNFESTVNGQPLLSMREGCAGFFSQEELDAGKGLVTPNIIKKQQLTAKFNGWEELIPVSLESYDAAQIKSLRKKELVSCFGPLFEKLNVDNPVTLPTGLMELADRVIEVNPTGGKYGGGFISAEADIHPDDWFLTCHFADDNVMPGTLMYECCLHTLRIYLLRIGWVGQVGEVVYEPIPGVSSGLKCRGQVIETTKVARYDIHIKEIGYRPEPYVIADAIMYADDKPIVEISNMSVQLSGLSKEKLEARWSGDRNAEPTLSYPPPTAGEDKGGGDFNHLSPSPSSPPLKGGGIGRGKPIFDNESILAFSIGKPSDAFGEPYKVFDSERIVARLPGPPYKFLDRIVAVEGEQYKMVAGGSATAEYDVPPDEWYFGANNQQVMPFAILLEIALQPCGWLAGYVGSALTSDIDLSFRNLGGSAIQYMPIYPDVGTLTIKADIAKVSQSGGMIIQNYDYEVRSKKGVVYKGDTYFGFFTKAALAEQVGIRDAKSYVPTSDEIGKAKSFEYPSTTPYPSGMMRMLDEVKYYVKDGGPNRLGYIEGIKYVNPEEWFFKAHFYQDPVCPGSLGLESYLQLLRVVAQERWGDKIKGMVETVVIGEKHAWLYRGQIVQKNKEVKIQAVVNSIDDDNLIIRADGYLSADGKYIYQMMNIGIQYGRV
ncbi:MAG: type I polyketide synthase, partial [Nitrospinae bacterium]|nr:type I polyketide synthase [Nitrospinota bacterium]